MAAADPKPMASLSSTLLARKGQAKPAMRPQGFASFGYGTPHGPHDDLGWNDMGFDPGEPVRPRAADMLSLVPAPALPDVANETTLVPAAVEPPVVVRQQAALERELSAEPAPLAPIVTEAMPASFIRAAAGSKGKAAFTLRLDPDRHLRLRLACAVAHKSAQAVVTAALDAFLNAQPAVTDMARTAANHADTNPGGR